MQGGDDRRHTVSRGRRRGEAGQRLARVGRHREQRRHELAKRGAGTGVRELTILEVGRLEVDAGGRDQRAEPGEHRAEVPVHPEIVMGGRAHRDDADRFAPERFHRSEVEEILQAPVNEPRYTGLTMERGVRLPRGRDRPSPCRP